MIRVLQLPGTLSRLDGRMSVIMNIYRNLDREKIQFDFVTAIEGQKTYKNEIEELGGNVYLLNEKPSLKKMRAYIDKILTNNNYQFMHYHAISPWGCVLDVAHKHNVKVITQSHATEFSETTVKSIRNYLFSKNIIKNSDKLIAVSPEAGKKLFGKHKFEYIPTWIDKEKYKFSNNKREEIRTSLGIKENEMLIGHIGRFAIQKNHNFMIKAFEKLVKQDKKYHLALISDGPLKKNIEKYAFQHKIIDHVHFVGVVTNASDFYSAFDILWLPSRYEGLPTVSLEAQANGLSVLASNKITRQIKLGNVKFLPINIFSYHNWVELTVKNIKKRNQNIDSIFEKSIFKKAKVMNQWKSLYGLRRN